LLRIFVSRANRDSRAQFVESIRIYIFIAGKILESLYFTVYWMAILESHLKHSSRNMEDDIIVEGFLLWIIFIGGLLYPCVEFAWKKMKTLRIERNLKNFPIVHLVEEDYCAICRVEMPSGLQLKCGHVFHKECLQMCLTNFVYKCPLC